MVGGDSILAAFRPKLQSTLRFSLQKPSFAGFQGIQGSIFPPRHRLQCRNMSSPGPRSEPLQLGSTLRGDSGNVYTIQEILSERRRPLMCVYRASSEGKSFIIKDMIRGEFDYVKSLQEPLVQYPNLRVMADAIPEEEMLAYNFMDEDLLQFSRRPLSPETRRNILKSALTGLAELHDRRIIHTDIKPSNILINYDNVPGSEPAVTEVRISDLEDAVLLDPGKSIKGCLSGNELWRSPESWARAKQNTPSDVYSFAIVAIYVMLDVMVFWDVNKGKRPEGETPDRFILMQHLSYFGDVDGLDGLLGHIGREDPFFDSLHGLAGQFSKANPRTPLTGWQGIDTEFRDVMVKMTSLDPKRRIAAREALEHPWFRNAES